MKTSLLKGLCIVLGLFWAAGAQTPVCQFNFNEGSGDSILESVNNVKFPIIGTKAWTSGKTGSALQFNGTNTTVNVKLSMPVSKRIFTVTCWIKPTSSRLQEILGQERCGEDIYEWRLYLTAGNGLGFAATDFLARDFGLMSGFGAGAVPLNAWTHIALSRNQKDWKLYVNGVLASSKTTTESIDLDSNKVNVIIGDRWEFDAVTPRASELFTGAMDDLRGYNQCLTDQQVAAIAAGSQTRILTNQATQVISGAQVRFQNGCLLIPNTTANQIQTIGVYSISGEHIVSYAVKDGQTSLKTDLKPGVYCFLVTTESGHYPITGIIKGNAL